MAKDQWIEINANLLIRNIKNIKRIVGDNVQLAPVVKGNAYGHGLLGTAQILDEASEVQFLSLTSLEDAILLQKEGIKKSMLLLKPLQMEEIPLVNEKMHVTVTSLNVLDKLNKASSYQNQCIPIHIKVDTGMSRFGIETEKVNDFINHLQSLNHLRLAGVWTHLASPNDEKAVKEQMAKFKSCIDVKKLRKAGVLIHISSSAPIINFKKELWFDLVRPGLATYGIGINNDSSFGQALNWYSKIIAIKSLAPNTKVGYGGTYKTESPTLLGIVPVGFIHGYPINKTRNSYVIVNNHRIPIVGRISMEYMTINCNDIPNVKIGDTVLITGIKNELSLTVDDLIKDTDFIPNEFICNINRSISRSYVK